MPSVDPGPGSATNPSADAGIQFDAFAAQQPNSTLATWTIWAGPSIDHPTWSVTASPYTPSALLADLTETLARGTGTRHTRPVPTAHGSPSIQVAPALPTRGTGRTRS
ncbi:DUF317 domain-containing protein [Streptomyces sp. SP17KL33]|uniref:DUF317 domain-containing protein n=1 Tax=Streptomyces sp. SP17KL33 TaxID=3002534 RepID=UPI002E75A297|nr:DUF317 domain-containing protein [Streptomyces sp. SP17KL33]MEE1836781.1 DUF317 domain-containing protein [Streptomyces sp. SP17KL33]